MKAASTGKTVAGPFQVSLPPMSLDGARHTDPSAALADLNAAVDACIKREALAAHLGVSASYLSRVLSGQHMLPIDWLDVMPEPIVVSFADRMVRRRNARVVREDETVLAIERLATAAMDVLRLTAEGGR